MLHFTQKQTDWESVSNIWDAGLRYGQRELAAYALSMLSSSLAKATMRPRPSHSNVEQRLVRRKLKNSGFVDMESFEQRLSVEGIIDPAVLGGSAFEAALAEGRANFTKYSYNPPPEIRREHSARVARDNFEAIRDVWFEVGKEDDSVGRQWTHIYLCFKFLDLLERSSLYPDDLMREMREFETVMWGTPGLSKDTILALRHLEEPIAMSQA